MKRDEDKPEELDLFWRNRVFPEAEALFSFQPRSITEIIAKALIVVDTNVLLVPYSVGKQSMERIRQTYADLVNAGRLIVPGQVAREFASQRAEHLKTVFQELWRKKNSTIRTHTYPLLESSTQYAAVISAEKELLERWGEYQRQVDKAIIEVREWYWNDPVSQLYHALFTQEVVVDPPLKPSELAKDLEWRMINKVPPGYKDAGKEDRGIGDLLIWHTILEIGQTQKKDLIFVSADRKTDWWHQSEGQALYPRFELVDEYRRKSAGHSFHIIGFSDLLALFGASETIVDEVRKEEVLTRNPSEEIVRGKGQEVRSAVEMWLRAEFPKADVLEAPRDEFPDFFVITPDGKAIGIHISVTPTLGLATKRVQRSMPRASISLKTDPVDSLIIAVLTPDFASSADVNRFVRSIASHDERIRVIPFWLSEAGPIVDLSFLISDE